MQNMSRILKQPMSLRMAEGGQLLAPAGGDWQARKDFANEQLGQASAQSYSSLASAAMSGINTLSAELKNE